MEKIWYARVMGEEIGPMSDAELRSMAGQGRLSPSDEVRKGSSPWMPASDVRGVHFGVGTQSVAVREGTINGMRAVGVTAANPYATAPARRRWPWIAGSALLALIAFGAISETAYPPEGTANAALRESKKVVLGSIKTPATASFPTTPNVVKGDDGWWTVTGEIDAENQFGAMMRKRWVARVRRTSDRKWTGTATIVGE